MIWRISADSGRPLTPQSHFGGIAGTQLLHVGASARIRALVSAGMVGALKVYVSPGLARRLTFACIELRHRPWPGHRIAGVELVGRASFLEASESTLRVRA